MSWVTPDIITTLQAIMIYGEADLQLVAGGISESIVGAILGLIVFVPLLVLFQWGVGRYFTKRISRRQEPPSAPAAQRNT